MRPEQARTAWQKFLSDTQRRTSAAMYEAASSLARVSCPCILTLDLTVYMRDNTCLERKLPQFPISMDCV